MLEALLPPAVAVAETRAELLDDPLFPVEAAVVARAVERRRLEFTTGRACARAALGKLGQGPVAIPAGAKGEPCWPPGVVGSITHCEGYRASAVAPDTALAALGIDAEPDLALPDGLLPDIALPGERRRLAELGASASGPCWDRVLFSAKEAVYKAWFALAERWLGFEDAELTIDAGAGTFSARLLVPGPRFAGAPLRGFEGRWAAVDGVVLTAVAVPVVSGRSPG